MPVFDFVLGFQTTDDWNIKRKSYVWCYIPHLWAEIKPSRALHSQSALTQTNSRRFRRTMLFLLLGLIFLFVGGVSATLRLDVGANALLTFFSSIGAVSLFYFIEEEEYLTLEWQSDGDE